MIFIWLRYFGHKNNNLHINYLLPDITWIFRLNSAHFPKNQSI